MSGINKVTLIGNLGRDPEVRHGQDGSKIVTLNIATSETWKDKNTGDRRERTEWHRVVIFNDHFGDVAEKYLKKGDKVYVEGANHTRKWTGQDGVDRYSTEVVISRFKGELELLGSPSGGGNSGAQSESDYGRTSSRPAQQAPTEPPSGWQPPADFDDEIPF